MDSIDSQILREPVPLFPLPNAVLLPGAVLPLHIFEPRYRVMTSDLLAQARGRRLLAIALLKDLDPALYRTNQAPVQSIVGLGEIIHYAPRDDGCYDILVCGQARAGIVRDDGSGIYRRAQLRLLPTEPTDLLAGVHDAVDHVRHLLQRCGELEICESALTERLLQSGLSAAAMIDLGTFYLTGAHDVAVKQRILEERQLEVRAEILAGALQRTLDAWERARSPSRFAVPWPPSGSRN